LADAITGLVGTEDMAFRLTSGRHDSIPINLHHDRSRFCVFSGSARYACVRTKVREQLTTFGGSID